MANEIKHTIRNDLSLMKDCIKCCFIEVSTKGRNIVCGSIYQPPNTNVSEFQTEITKCMDKIKLESHKDIVVGMDHNLDFLKSKNHSGTQNFITAMLDRLLFPCITRLTRVTTSTATLIDNIVVNSRVYDSQKSCVVVHDICDHFLSLIIVKDVWIDKREPKKVLTRDLNDCKVSALNTGLATQNWSECYKQMDLNDQYSKFIGIVNKTLNNHIPIREITIPVKKLVCKPWLTKGLRKCGKKTIKTLRKV